MYDFVGLLIVGGMVAFILWLANSKPHPSRRRDVPTDRDQMLRMMREDAERRALKIRLEAPSRLGDDGTGPEAIAIHLKGEIPVTASTNIAFVTSVIDVTDKDSAAAVVCTYEGFQEAETRAFQVWRTGSSVEPGQGFHDWITVGLVVPDFLVPGYSGQRKLHVVCRIVDQDNPPSIDRGFCSSDQPGAIATLSVQYLLDFQGRGYLEAAQDRDDSRKVMIELAMAIAMADGELHETEGYAIKHWVERTVAMFSDERAIYLKKLYNTAIRDAYAQAQAGTLSLGAATTQLNELADNPLKYEAVELCLAVMTADGAASDGELRAVRNIAKALSVDNEEFKMLLDKSLLGVASNETAGAEALLGIQSDWTEEQVKGHLRKEYAKWSSRLTSLKDGPDRESAQQMVETIAAARAKHAA